MNLRPVAHLSEVAKTGGLLAAMVVHNLVYPMSSAGGAGAVLFYVFYAVMFTAGVWILTSESRWRGAATVAGIAVLLAGMVNSFAATSGSALAVYLTSIAYHAVIIGVLARYTFAPGTVQTEIVLAATTLYLILGSIFAAIFGALLWLDPGAFVSSAGAEIQWQQLLYYSYVTLTTLGYGDIIPVGHVAQAIAAFEAIIGTLYSVLLLSRLVGLHASGKT